MSRLNTAIGARLGALAACLEPQSAARLRELGDRALRGEAIDAAELGEALPPRHGGPLSMLSLSGCGDRQWYERVGRVGVLSIDGPIFFSCGFFEMLFLGLTPTAAVVDAFTAAREDELIDELVVRMHCGGGSMAGMSDLMAAVDTFRAAGKRLSVCVNDMMASAAVWAFCVADEIVVTASATMGSVGGIIPYVDTSKAAAEIGVKPAPVTTSLRKAKGVGMFGLELTEALLDDDKRIIEKSFGEFVQRLSAARKIPAADVRGQDARMYLGGDAVEKKLADRVVGSFDQYLQERTGAGAAATAPHTPAAAPPEEPRMDIKTAKFEDLQRDNPALLEQVRAQALAAHKPAPATIAELKTAFPGAESSLFREDCLEKGLSLVDARAAHAGVLAQQLAAEKAERAKAEARVKELEALNGAGRGAPPVGGSAGKEGGKNGEQAKDLGAAPGPRASKEEREAYAKKEWEADHQGCRSSGKFISDQVYAAARARELAAG